MGKRRDPLVAWPQAPGGESWPRGFQRDQRRRADRESGCKCSRSSPGTAAAGAGLSHQSSISRWGSAATIAGQATIATNASAIRMSCIAGSFRERCGCRAQTWSCPYTSQVTHQSPKWVIEIVLPIYAFLPAFQEKYAVVQGTSPHHKVVTNLT